VVDLVAYLVCPQCSGEDFTVLSEDPFIVICDCGLKITIPTTEDLEWGPSPEEVEN